FAARTAALAGAAPDPDVIARFRERMDDDLDTPGATALLFDTVRKANAALDAAAPEAAALAAAVHEICTAVGLVLAVASDVPAEAAAKANALDAARAAKDFAAADALRAELQADGWIVETTKAGTSLRR
ncbi:MAG: DALR domain-containing protein, partial [Ilumatobacteraceae bacterium]